MKKMKGYGYSKDGSKTKMTTEGAGYEKMAGGTQTIRRHIENRVPNKNPVVKPRGHGAATSGIHSRGPMG